MSRSTLRFLLLALGLMTLGSCVGGQISSGGSRSTRRFTGPARDVLEFTVISENILKFSYSREGETPPASLMVESEPQPTGQILTSSKDGFVTETREVRVDAQTLCFRIKAQGADLVQLCPGQIKSDGATAMAIGAPRVTHLYGLGEEFRNDEGSPTNWLGRLWSPGDEFGNKMAPFAGGAVGNAQFPILYALAPGLENFALLLDNTYAQTWEFHAQPWSVQMTGGPRRGFVLTGANLPALRQAYMSLVGRPPVPPRKAFGLWVSEYGFDNWQELDGKLRTLRQHQFPVDGMVLDLQWFGNIKGKSEDSQMGGLQWDETHFPHPREKIKTLGDQGIGIVTIEEPFISRAVKDRQTGKKVYDLLAEKKFLAMSGSGPEAQPVRLDSISNWWGYGGMLDFAQEAAADFWHDWKRQPLIEDGVIGHWTDLGEPEAFQPSAFYDQGQRRHKDIHNVYNLLWSRSVFRGYQRHQVARRPWILSRSGTIGSPRYGVSLWSGDIGSNFASLRAQLRVQTQMSLSGVDYFGSDIGGFHREALPKGEELRDLYTQWFADSSLFDIPVRPHTENLCNCRETAPDRVGDRESNLANLKLRYQLIPYYYSLAHRAFASGDPIVTPLFYEFQNDEVAREISDEKMIGPFLLAAALAKAHVQSRDIYLPKGKWFDYHTHKPVLSSGQWLKAFPVAQKPLRLPLFAREGAIVPLSSITGSMNALQAEWQGLRIYPSAAGSSFVVTEDDGWSQAYLKGALRTTRVDQRVVTAKGAQGSVLSISIHAAQGDIADAPKRTAQFLEVITPNKVLSVKCAGVELVRGSKEEGWTQEGSILRVRLAPRALDQATQVEVVWN